MSRACKTPVLVRDVARTPSAGTAGKTRHQTDLFQQALPLEAADISRQTASRKRTVERLWFCVYLPRLPLEALSVSEDVSGNVSGDVSGGASGASSGKGQANNRAVVRTDFRAIVEEQQGIHRILLPDARAAEAGILPGQSANAALALLPELTLELRNPLCEQQTLEALATWLEQYSSFVSIVAADVLLLEIAGSLRLFGGLKTLGREIVAGFEQRGFDVSPAIAPTPLAAIWLARGGRRACVHEFEKLLPALRNLPLDCLDWPQTALESLTGMGIGNVGDCLRLPRDGFAKRFGPSRLLELDRALGRLPDPRPSWRAPERFLGDHEMAEEQDDCQYLLAICHELLVSHESFLLARQLGTQRLRFTFFHLKARATRLLLGSATAERLADRWFDLLRIRFERVALPEPVIAIRLEGGRTQALETGTGPLAFNGQARSGFNGRVQPAFNDRAQLGTTYSMNQLAERLTARIGAGAVYRVSNAADHRPQLAWRKSTALAGKTVDVASTTRRDLRRPLWMLPEPVLLEAEQGWPRHRGRLTLREGPERLETGWWDEQSIARDYYTAIDPRGVRLWIYRDRKPRCDVVWYLHGIFG